MVIGICDDDSRARIEMKDILEDTLEDIKKPYEVLEYEDGKEVLFDKRELDLLILDIELPFMDGISLKNELQKRSVAPMIIYVSSHDELVMEAFGLQVIGFVTKSALKEKLPHMLRAAIKLQKSCIMIDERINSRDVCYIEADYSYSRLVCNDEKQYLLRISMDNLETMLSVCDFIRVHRKYLVNMEYVDRIRKQELEIGKKTIPIATRLRSKVKKAYDEYARENARYL